MIEKDPPLNASGEPWSEQRWKIDAINGTMSIDSILKIAEYIEENKIPTVFYIGHSVMPFITLETAYKIALTAPHYCLGFRTAEDEDFGRIPDYMQQYFAPLSHFCARHGMEFSTTNKNAWWAAVTAYPEVAQYLFTDDTKKTLSASTEDSNSRTPEINLMARYGLYLAGEVNGLTVNVHQDMFSFNRFFQWEYPKHGHPFLRLMMAHTLLGGRSYNLRIPYKYKDSNGDIAFTRLGEESVEPFMELLGKGIVFCPRPDEIAGTSEIGIAFEPPSGKWLKDAINGHSPETWEADSEMQHAIIPFNGCEWGMTPTPGFAMQKVLFHKDRQFGLFIPPTPYGLVPIMPANQDLRRAAGVNRWIHTDGIYLWEDENHKMTGQDAADFLKNIFEEAAKNLAFRTSGDDVFTQVLKLRDGQYRLFLIDPGWLDPADRQVIIFNQTHHSCRLKDVLTGEETVASATGNFKVKIPAGAFRILETF